MFFIVSDLNSNGNGILFFEESGCEENFEEEFDSMLFLCLEILNRFCLKIKEEVLISLKVIERIWVVIILFLRILNV